MNDRLLALLVAFASGFNAAFASVYFYEGKSADGLFNLVVALVLALLAIARIYATPTPESEA